MTWKHGLAVDALPVSLLDPENGRPVRFKSDGASHFTCNCGKVARDSALAGGMVSVMPQHSPIGLNQKSKRHRSHS